MVGGAVGEVRPAAGAVGTEVVVEDLFFATPARLKFLRSPPAELQAVGDIVRRLALAHPTVALELWHEGRRLQAHAAEADRRTRAIAVLGPALVDAVHVVAERDGIALEGVCALPTAAARTARQQVFVVNRRPVTDRLLQGALKAAYADLVVHDRHPVALIHLDVRPDLVDVNVHPAKAEVRFREPGVVRGLVVAAIKRALAEGGRRTAQTVSAAALGSFTGAAPGAGVRPAVVQRPLGLREEAPAFVPEPAPPTPVEEAAGPLGRARAQLHGTWIVAEAEDALVLVDMHAAHERIVYEELKAGLAAGVPSQILLLPAVVELDDAAVALVEGSALELARLGLLVERFGRGAVLVRGMPAPLAQADPAELVRDVAEDLADQAAPVALDERLLRLAARAACHGSVRSGRQLAPAEMDALLRAMERTPNAGQCNHGRPTYVRLERRELERLFQRR